MGSEEKKYDTPIGVLIEKTLFQYNEDGMPFMAVVLEAIKNKELVTQFDRLWGAHVSNIGKGSALELAINKATGFDEHQFMLFANFIYDCVWTRMPTVKLTPEQVMNQIKIDMDKIYSEKNKS